MEVKLTLPASWNELTDIQFKNIVHQLETYQKIIKDTPEVIAVTSAKLYIQLAKELLRGNKYKDIRIALKEIQPKEFQPWSKFIYEKIERTKFFKTLKIAKEIFYGPDIRFRNATIAEFSYVDAVWYKWRTSHQEIWLNVLCGALYREKSATPNDIDIRKPFVKISVDARADKFAKVNLKTKLAIAYTYEGCRNQIAKTFPNVFPAPQKVDGKVIKTLQNQTYHSFGDIILDKIKGDPSKLHITNSVLVYDFLAIVEKDIKDFRKRPTQ